MGEGDPGTAQRGARQKSRVGNFARRWWLGGGRGESAEGELATGARALHAMNSAADTTKPYLLKSQVARQYGLKVKDVPKIFPVTLLGGRERFLKANIERIEREATFAPRLEKFQRAVALAEEPEETLARLRAEGIAK